jgi:hypothetical protein
MTRCFVPQYLLTFLAFFSVACGYDNGDRISAAATADTVLGTIDTDAVMDPASMTGGAGVFVEYATGGKWKLQVGCDTAKSGADCAWDIIAYSPEGGHFFSSESLDLENSDLLMVYSDGQLELQAITGADFDGVSFVAEPGEPVTFDVWLEGASHVEDFFYYISDGAVRNGAASSIIELTPTAD